MLACGLMDRHSMYLMAAGIDVSKEPAISKTMCVLNELKPMPCFPSFRCVLVQETPSQEMQCFSHKNLSLVSSKAFSLILGISQTLVQSNR